MNRSELKGVRQMDTDACSVRTDSRKIKQLDKLAEQQDRSRNYLVNQARDQFLELHAWQEERIQAGIKAADDGRFVGEVAMKRIFGKYENG